MTRGEPSPPGDADFPRGRTIPKNPCPGNVAKALHWFADRLDALNARLRPLALGR